MGGTGRITGRDPWSATVAPRRHAPPGALPLSAVSARGPDGAHAIGSPSGQAWSSPCSPPLVSQKSHGEPRGPRRCSACGSRLVMPAHVSAQTQSRFRAYARAAKLALSRSGPALTEFIIHGGPITLPGGGVARALLAATRGRAGESVSGSQIGRPLGQMIESHARSPARSWQRTRPWPQNDTLTDGQAPILTSGDRIAHSP